MEIVKAFDLELQLTLVTQCSCCGAPVLLRVHACGARLLHIPTTAQTSLFISG